MTKELREIFMSFQWGGDCARNIISKKLTCIGVELGASITKTDLSKSYDRVRYQTNNKESSFYPQFFKKPFYQLVKGNYCLNQSRQVLS